MAKISDLSSATSIADSDILHIRTTGGVDKKITGSDTRSSIVGQVITSNSTETISLSTYVTNVTIVGTQTAPITLTINNTLTNGKVLKILNPTDFIMTVVIGGQTIEVSRDGELNFTSNGSAMIIGRPNLTTITGNTAYTINKGTRGKIFVCEPTADMDLTITAGSGADEREYITVINNSAYLVTVKDSTQTYWLDQQGQKVDFRIDYDGDLRRSPGKGLIYDDYSNITTVTMNTLNQFKVDEHYYVIFDESTTPSLIHASHGFMGSVGTTCYGTDSGSSIIRFDYNVSTTVLGNQTSSYKVKKIWRIYT